MPKKKTAAAAVSGGIKRSAKLLQVIKSRKNPNKRSSKRHRYDQHRAEDTTSRPRRYLLPFYLLTQASYPPDCIDRKSIFAGGDINSRLPGGPIFGIQVMPADARVRCAAHPKHGTAADASWRMNQISPLAKTYCPWKGDKTPIGVRNLNFEFNYRPVHRSQMVAVQPQTALKITTNSGVSIPSSRPMAPFLAFIGKTTKS